MSVLALFIISAALPAPPTPPNRGTLSTGARKMEVPVRMNTTRPVSLCSLCGGGRVSWVLGEPPRCQALRHGPDTTRGTGRREVEGPQPPPPPQQSPRHGVQNWWRGTGRALQFGCPRPLHQLKLIGFYFYFDGNLAVFTGHKNFSFPVSKLFLYTFDTLCFQ